MANSKTEVVQITPVNSQRLVRLLKTCAVANKLSTFVWGPPGIGKSDTVRQLGLELGAPVLDVRLSSFDPTDVRGIAYFNTIEQKMMWAPPISWPTKEFAAEYDHVILFLDEINSAPPSVQAAAYQLILDRRIGEYELPENVAIIAAGNRETDKGVTYKMATPLANRFVHLEMRADINTWFDWAIENEINSAVAGFLKQNNARLMDFQPNTAGRSFPTPRSWAMLAQLMDSQLSDDDLRTFAEGTVGVTAATEFIAHLKYHHRLPAASDVLDGKVKELNVKEISAHYGLVINLYYELLNRYRNMSKEDQEYNGRDPSKEAKSFYSNMDNLIDFIMNNLTDEMGVLAMTVILQGRTVEGRGEGGQIFLNTRCIDGISRFQQRYGSMISYTGD